jgi:hypothetical protein
MIILEPSGSPLPDYKRCCDLMFLTHRHYTIDDHILSGITDPSIYLARLDSIMVTWILGTLSPELHKIIQEPTEIAC